MLYDVRMNSLRVSVSMLILTTVCTISQAQLGQIKGQLPPNQPTLQPQQKPDELTPNTCPLSLLSSAQSGKAFKSRFASNLVSATDGALHTSAEPVAGLDEGTQARSESLPQAPAPQTAKLHLS